MAIFRPPTDNFVTQGPINGESMFGIFSVEERLRRRLSRFYPASPRGRNVYWLLDGTFTENDPSDPNDIRTVFYGGHDNIVTAEEEAALIAAGYGGYIT